MKQSEWVQLCINSGLMGKLLTRGAAEKIWSKVKGGQGEMANRRGLFLLYHSRDGPTMPQEASKMPSDVSKTAQEFLSTWTP